MAKQIIQTPDAPYSTLFSQAIKVGATVYLSGIVGIDPATNRLAGLTIQDQTRQALINCQNILRAAGAELEHVVEVYVLLANSVDFTGLNEEYAKFFPTNPPTRAVAKLGVELPNVLVSIKMTAAL
jgi:2-iminobutanoate/2-iminopropanoate deaminase